MLEFLPEDMRNEILKRTRGTLTELRIRQDRPVRAAEYFCGRIIKREVTEKKASRKDIEKIILKLCDFSIYSKETNIKNGYITSKNGERVGICGTVVYDGEKVSTIKEFSSLVVRIPNDISGCSVGFISGFTEKPLNVLVVSPPYNGKTTFIRDLGRQYSDRFGINALFIDERDELTGGGAYYLGKNSDVMKYCDKAFGIRCGVRNLNPDVIVCDEIMSSADADALKFAKESGVKIIASAHSDNLENIIQKEELSKIFKCFMFDIILFLKDFSVSSVYDGKLNKLC